LPHRDETFSELLHAEEKHGREVESRTGLGAAGEIPGLPGDDGRHARNAVRLTHVGHRVGCLRRRGREDQVRFVGQDQLTGYLRGAVRARLRVLDDNLYVEGFAAELEAILEGARPPYLAEDAVITGSKPCQRAGLGADVADHDRAAARGARALDLAAGR